MGCPSSSASGGLSCPAGKKGNGKGKTSEAAGCINCPVGKYSDSEGSTACSTCVGDDLVKRDGVSPGQSSQQLACTTKLTTWRQFLLYAGYAIACVAPLTLLYKVNLYRLLRNNNLLATEYRGWSGLAMVLAYGNVGKHVVTIPDDDAGEEGVYRELIDSDVRVRMPRRENSVLEMGRRESMTEFLKEAKLEAVSDQIFNFGVYSTVDLNDLEDEVIEKINLPELKKIQLKKALQSR